MCALTMSAHSNIWNIPLRQEYKQRKLANGIQEMKI